MPEKEITYSGVSWNALVASYGNEKVWVQALQVSTGSEVFLKITTLGGVSRAGVFLLEARTQDGEKISLLGHYPNSEVKPCELTLIG